MIWLFLLVFLFWNLFWVRLFWLEFDFGFWLDIGCIVVKDFGIGMVGFVGVGCGMFVVCIAFLIVKGFGWRGGIFGVNVESGGGLIVGVEWDGMEVCGRLVEFGENDDFDVRVWVDGFGGWFLKLERFEYFCWFFFVDLNEILFEDDDEDDEWVFRNGDCSCLVFEECIEMLVEEFMVWVFEFFFFILIIWMLEFVDIWLVEVIDIDCDVLIGGNFDFLGYFLEFLRVGFLWIIFKLFFMIFIIFVELL